MAFLGIENMSFKDGNERTLHLLDSQGNLDHTVVQKLKDMKAEFERQANEHVKEKAMDRLRIEALSKRIQENE